MAPVDAKARWDPDFSRRRLLQADLQRRLPGHAVNMGGATSVDVTRAGIDKAYGMRRLCAESAIAPDAMLFIGDALFPSGNDYPVKAMGIDTVAVRGPDETRTVIASLLAPDSAEQRR
jgi:hydroxymethylpyrimidine pyrophosphatase-like HAD family hydrolase